MEKINCLAYFRLNWCCVKYSLVESCWKLGLFFFYYKREKCVKTAYFVRFLVINLLQIAFFYQRTLIVGFSNTHLDDMMSTAPSIWIAWNFFFLTPDITEGWNDCYNNFSWEKRKKNLMTIFNPLLSWLPSVQTLSLCRKSVVLFLSLNRFGWNFLFSLFRIHPLHFSHMKFHGRIFVWKARSGWKIQFTVIVTFLLKKHRAGWEKRFCVCSEKECSALRFPQILITNATCENSYMNFRHL